MTGWYRAIAPLAGCSFALLGCELGPDTDLPSDIKGATLTVAAEPSGTEFAGSVAVRLHSDVPADIYYTLDGSSPSGPGAQRYEGPLTLIDATLLSFIAVTEAGSWSTPQVELYRRLEEVPRSIPAVRALRLSTKNIFFQAKPGDGPSEQAVTVRSVGLQRIRIKRVMIGYNPAGGSFYQPEVFELLTEFPEERSLAPGESLDVLLRYTPTESFASAALLFETDDGTIENGLYYVELWGRIFPW